MGRRRHLGGQLSERSSKRILSDGVGQSFPDRIHPDVVGNRFDGLVWTENMIEKFLLPERLRLLLAVLTTGLDFERLDKVREIAGWEEALGQEMKMIRQNAIGVDCEIPSDGFGAENLEKPAAGRRVGEYSASAVATERHKITLATYVAVRRETNILVKVHVWAPIESARRITRIVD